ncbi:hypothetical protein Kpol_1035p11 [Vanderwaltozyma polyspora DSM 70294]|uniref:Ribonuclease P protein subunit n=1 Tax=Vanderwaltozyma polyspora (strain ATCC 22028 / DSM 70294 / BCRC 21397 / CBS 2163 / NBRC 10782 / NRRL Y-8283 / UCD 57-17) TaxID=436907 RepID=A7TKH7_VANPO|nr:uncharacterized protein Kpol_1035p11 [Vanderwaltozyma polyspora DSM 70294]EDO17199.1 hypothetical protein Kpol_1035p11 [Vanderwaltozyma polyspora DSM 70294]
MDRVQNFIKECLFVKNFDNPNKPIDENRLQETLLLLPTDGGLTGRLMRSRSQMKISASSIESGGSSDNVKHPNYREINKNSREALHDYIVKCKKSALKVKKIVNSNNFNDRYTLEDYLQSKEPLLWQEIPKYDKFLPMYEILWVGYVKELLNIPLNIKDAKSLSINGTTALSKLSMADYNGALLKVVHSKNKNMIGIEGIVVWDSQKNFIMVTKGELYDQLKIIPKNGTVFGFQVPINDDFALQYSILGDRFKYRSSDRAGRKFKSRRCDDMYHYIKDQR